MKKLEEMNILELQGVLYELDQQIAVLVNKKKLVVEQWNKLKKEESTETAKTPLGKTNTKTLKKLKTTSKKK